MGKGIIFSKIYSNGNMLSFFKDKFEDNLIRTAAKTVSKSGYDEPVEKIIYPSLGFKIDNWKTKSQLLYNKRFPTTFKRFCAFSNFQYLLFNKKRNVSINVKAGHFKNCIYIEGKGESEFIADTRSGPIKVDIFTKEWVCPGVGIVKQQRQENTKASAFGNMSLEKVLINFKE